MSAEPEDEEMRTRQAIANQINGIIPPPWTRNDHAAAYAAGWRAAADFVERYGEWKDYPIDAEDQVSPP